MQKGKLFNIAATNAADVKCALACFMGVVCVSLAISFPQETKQLSLPVKSGKNFCPLQTTTIAGLPIFYYLTQMLTIMKMKHPRVWISALFAAVLFCSAAKLRTTLRHAEFKQSTTIKGTVNPPEAATQVWAVSATENFKTIVANGSFELKGVRPGTYDIQIRAAAPYKDAVKTGIIVTDDSQIDLGEIKMGQ